MKKVKVTLEDKVPPNDIIIQDIPNLSTQDLDILVFQGNGIDDDVKEKNDKKNQEIYPPMNISARDQGDVSVITLGNTNSSREHNIPPLENLGNDEQR